MTMSVADIAGEASPARGLMPLWVGVGIYALSNWERERDFRPLYTSLAPEDASVIVQKLKESATPFRLTNNGTTVSAPEDKVAELRLEMAGAGEDAFDLRARDRLMIGDDRQHFRGRARQFAPRPAGDFHEAGEIRRGAEAPQLIDLH